MDEALEVAVSIVDEVYRNTGAFLCAVIWMSTGAAGRDNGSSHC